MTDQAPQPLSYHTPPGLSYLPLGPRAKPAVTLLWVMLALTLITAPLALLAANLQQPGAVNPSNASHLIGLGIAMMAVGCISFAVLIATAVFFLMWVYRANNNLRVLGTLGMQFTPTWSIVWWFIPLANWVVPFFILRELHAASGGNAPGQNTWRHNPSSPLLILWWLTWIGAALLSIVGSILPLFQNRDLILISGWFNLASNLASACGAVCAAMLVNRITERVEHLALSQPVPTPGTFPTTLTVQATP